MLLCCYGFLRLVTSFETIYYLYVTICYLFVCYIIIKFVTIVWLLCSLDALFLDTFQRNFLNGKATHFYNGTFPLFSLNHHLNAATSQDGSPSVELSCSIRCRVGSRKTSFFTRVEFSEDWSSSLSP